MSLIAYTKDKNMDIITMDKLIKKFKTTSDNLELIQLLEFMGERLNLLTKKCLVNSPEQVKQVNKQEVSEQSEFLIKSFKITTSKLYLILGENEALEYEFNKDNISECYEYINSNRINKNVIGVLFKKISI